MVIHRFVLVLNCDHFRHNTKKDTFTKIHPPKFVEDKEVAPSNGARVHFYRGHVVLFSRTIYDNMHVHTHAHACIHTHTHVHTNTNTNKHTQTHIVCWEWLG